MLADTRAYKKLAADLSPRILDFFGRAMNAPKDKCVYASHVQSLGSWYAYAYYLALVEKFIPDRDTTILDWGGQFGHVAALFQSRYPKTMCYIADQEEVGDLLNYWQNLFNTNNIVRKNPQDPMSVISLPSDSMGAAFSSGVLEHTREYGVTELEALQELYRVLKPNGYLFIFHLPTKYGFPEVGNMILRRWHHEFRYTETEISELLKASGFKIAALDKHEFLYPSMRNMMGNLIGHANAFWLDYKFSKLPLVNFAAQHFTIVAQKPAS